MSNSQENIKATIMVRGISQCSENDIWESFDKIGKVKDIRRIKDRFTGEFKDFAFVEFENEEEADLTVELSMISDIRINGKPVSVCKSKNKKAENFIQDKNNPNYGYGIEIEPLVYNSRNNQLKSNECAGTDSLLDISLKSNGLKPEESFNHSIPL